MPGQAAGERLQPDDRDLADAPHRLCRFGQWYYGQGQESLAGHPSFRALEEELDALRAGWRMLKEQLVVAYETQAALLKQIEDGVCLDPDCPGGHRCEDVRP